MRRILECQNNANVCKIRRCGTAPRMFEIGIRIKNWDNNRIHQHLFVYSNGWKSANKWAEMVVKHAKKEKQS